MKNIFITILLGLISVNSYANSILIDKITTREYNEILNSFIDREMNIWAGIDKDGRKFIQFDIDGSIEDIWFNVYLGSDEFNYIKDSFIKFDKWAKIASENKTEIEKQLVESEKGCALRGYSKAKNGHMDWCKIYFMSYSGGDYQQIYWSLENFDNIWSKDTTLYIKSGNARAIAKYLTETELNNKFVKLTEKQSKEDLFN